MTDPVLTIPPEPIPTSTTSSPSALPWKLLTAVLLLLLVGTVSLLAIDTHSKQTSTQPTTQPTPTATENTVVVTSSSPSSIPTVLDPSLTPLSKVGLAMKVPNELFYYEPVMEVEVAQTRVEGAIYCLTFARTSQKEKVAPCGENDIMGSALSIDNELGRESDIFDARGYTFENGQYFLNMYSQKTAVPVNSAKEMTSATGVKFLLINHDESLPVGDFPSLWPQKGYQVAVVNTRSENYPGLVLKAKIEDGISPETFEKLLMSFEYY